MFTLSNLHVFLVFFCSHSSNESTSDSSSSFIDSDTRDRIYAELHFSSKLSQQDHNDDDSSTSTSGNTIVCIIGC